MTRDRPTSPTTENSSTCLHFFPIFVNHVWASLKICAEFVRKRHLYTPVLGELTLVHPSRCVVFIELIWLPMELYIILIAIFNSFRKTGGFPYIFYKLIAINEYCDKTTNKGKIKRKRNMEKSLAILLDNHCKLMLHKVRSACINCRMSMT
jgi:hypothetical protein